MAAPQLQIQVRELCSECFGAGTIGISTPFCAVCRLSFTTAQLRSHNGFFWRTHGKRLPCGHRIKHVRWTDPTCQACDGAGGQLRWLPLEWALRMQARLLEQSGNTGRGSATTRPLHHNTIS